MPLPATKLLKLARDGSVFTVTIDDPPTHNALSSELIIELTDVLQSTRGDLDCRALVLRGSKEVFCAGAHLKSEIMTEAGAGKEDPVVALSKNSAMLYRELNTHSAVVIAVVEGAAYGGGLGVACCADVVICGAGAKFSLSETTLGLVPAQIAPVVVGRIGLSAARRLSLTGARFAAAEAKLLGLADYVGDDDEAVEAALRTVLASVGRCAPHANAVTKTLLMQVGTMPQGEFVDYAARTFADALRFEGREGITAFQEKRLPSWAQSK